MKTPTIPQLTFKQHVELMFDACKAYLNGHGRPDGREDDLRNYLLAQIELSRSAQREQAQ
ncbi:MAG: hypothetical protein EKK55_22670 [Rhodocyclaceae bacterium]|nr:MAG: hypothetical protein EKK55_22670 [Rhodocyclaceae bacterium]